MDSCIRAHSFPSSTFIIVIPRQFIKYPPSDPEKVREEVQERIKREEKQKEQQKVYLEQMKRLQESADRSRKVSLDQNNNSQDNNNTSKQGGGGGLWGWLGFRKRADE